MGPGEESLTPTAANSMSGEVQMISISDPMMSMARLRKALPMLSSGMWRRLTSETPPISSIAGREGMNLL